MRDTCLKSRYNAPQSNNLALDGSAADAAGRLLRAHVKEDRHHDDVPCKLRAGHCPTGP